MLVGSNVSQKSVSVFFVNVSSLRSCNMLIFACVIEVYVFILC